MPGGRPKLFSKPLARKVLIRLAEGETLRAVCRDEAMPARATVRKWVLDVPEFAVQYARAREMGFEEMAEELIEIASTPVKAQKLTRKIEPGPLKKDGSPGEERVTQEVVVMDAVDRSRLRVDVNKWLLSKWAHKRYGDKPVAEGAAGDDMMKEFADALRSSPAAVDE